MSFSESAVKRIDTSLKKKRLSINPFAGITIQIHDEDTPKTAKSPGPNVEDIIGSASGSKRYSYLVSEASSGSLSNLRVLKPIIPNTSGEDLSKSTKRLSSLGSADAHGSARQSFNPGRRVSTFLNLGDPTASPGSLGPPSVSPKRSSLALGEKSPVDNEGGSSFSRASNTSSTNRPSMRAFRKATYVLQKMNEAGVAMSIGEDSVDLLSEERTSQYARRSSSPRGSTSMRSSRILQSDVDHSARQDQGSVFVTALQSLENAAPRPTAAIAAESETALNPAIVAPTPPPYVAATSESVDYSPMFPSNIGETEGTFVFRIEAMKPILIDPEEHGAFCIADSYIVMKSTPKNPQRPDSDLTHTFYTWIGVEAETDKRFCCAMYAVALRNLVHSDSRIVREIPGDESEELVRVFTQSDGSSGIRLLDASRGTDSGLFSANAKQYPIKLYRVDQRSAIPMFLVEKKKETLATNHVYLLDAGMEIYQWNGLAATLQNRSKARMIAARINKQERVGKAEFIEFDEKDEPDSFWESLEFKDWGEDEEELDEDFPISSTLELLQLYRVFPKIAPDLESHIVATGKIKKELLVTDGIYILDAGTELSLWIGKKAWNELKDTATTLLRAIAASKTRPSWIAVNKYAEGAEPESFKFQFCDWQEKAPPLPPKIVRKEELPNVDAILSPYTLYPADAIDCEDTMEIVNSFLETFSSFVYYRGKFIALPEAERGHFYEQDAYVFLCVYKAPETHLTTLLDFPLNDFDIPDLKLDATESLISSESEDVTLSCVVYFCQSRRTSKVPYSNFKLTTQKEMEDLVRGMYKCPLQVKLVDYGMEPFALLAHLENSYTLHRGSRLDRTRKGKVFQVRTDLRYQTTRSVEVDMTKSPLVSRDCFFFMDGEGAGVVWRGDDFDRTLLEFVVENVKSVQKLYHPSLTSREGSENGEEEIDVRLPPNIELVENCPKFKWRGNPNTNTSADTPKSPREEEYIPLITIPSEPPKLFFCSCNHGFFKVERYSHFIQKTLSAESCIMLDPGSDFPLYVWIGSQCSDAIRKLVRKSAMVWLNNCQDGRRLATDPFSESEFMKRSSISSVQLLEMAATDYSIRFIDQGNEPPEFKAYFISWDPEMFKVEEPGNLFTRSLGKEGWRM